MNYKKFTIEIFLLIAFNCYAAQQEQVVDFEDTSVPVLNNELRRFGRGIDDNSSDITSNKGKVMMDSSDTLGYLNTKVKNSIENDSNDLQLVGDESAPGNNKFYGTDGAGAKGWESVVDNSVVGFDDYLPEDSVEIGDPMNAWYTIDIEDEIWIYKTSNVTTCKVKFEGKVNNTSYTPQMRIMCGSTYGTAFTPTGAYVTYTKTVDISGLTDDDFYQVQVQGKCNQAGSQNDINAYAKNVKVAVY